jgi:hypothetical protein
MRRLANGSLPVALHKHDERGRRAGTGNGVFSVAPGPSYYFADRSTKGRSAGNVPRRDLDLEPGDAGPLTSARYIEPAGMLAVLLAYRMGLGAYVAMKLLRGDAA